jgi:Holliday junction resolvase
MHSENGSSAIGVIPKPRPGARSGDEPSVRSAVKAPNALNGEKNSLTPSVQGRRGGRRPRAKGDRIEREIVSRHTKIGIKAERYPLSGASRFRGASHDIDIYALGRDEGPFVAEVKSRRSGAGFVTLEKWLGEYDCLFLRRNSAEPMVLLPWRIWATLLARVQR